MMTQIYFGVDVSQARLDSFVATDAKCGVFESFDNTAEGIEALRAFALQHGAQMIVMEANNLFGQWNQYYLADEIAAGALTAIGF